MHEQEKQGVRKVIFYYNKANDPYFSEELLNEADENAMSFEGFLEYVTEQTGTSYDDLVDKSFEVFGI